MNKNSVKTRLTDTIVRDAHRYLDKFDKDQNREVWIQDLDVRGLGLRIQGAPDRVSRKVFYVRYRRDSGVGTSKFRLGEYPTEIQTVKQAREMAIQVLAAQYRGQLPELLRQSRGGCTVQQMMDFYCQEKGYKKTGNKDPHYVIHKYILPTMGTLRVGKLTRKKVMDYLSAIRRAHGRAARGHSLAYLRAGWNYCLNHMPDFEHTNVCMGIPGETFKARAVAVTREQYAAMARILRELHAEPRIDSKVSRLALLAIEMIVITGHRRGEICSIRLDDIMEDHIRIPRNKTNDQDKIIHRTAAVDSVITRARAIRMERGFREADNPYLFPSLNKGGTRVLKGNAYYSTQVAHNLIREREPLLRGLELKAYRSGSASVGRALGLTDAQIAAVTQHSDPRTVARHYARSTDELARSYAVQISEEIARQMSGS